MNVFFLHGPAAAGKYTVGRRLADELGVPLFHNHLTVDLTATLFEFGSPGFVDLREGVWRTSFETAAREGRSFVFTFQPEATVRAEFIPAVVQTVEECGGEVLFIELTCADEIAESRVNDESRAAFGKLRDVGLYRELRESGAFDFVSMPAASARVDTGMLSPEDAVVSILKQLIKDGRSFGENQPDGERSRKGEQRGN